MKTTWLCLWAVLTLVAARNAPAQVVEAVPDPTPVLTATPALSATPALTATPALSATPALTNAPAFSAAPALTASPVPATEPAPAAAIPCPACPTGSVKGHESMACCGVEDHVPATAAPADPEKVVRELEQRWCEAEARHDVAALEKIEADTFTFTDSTGHLTTKQDEIAMAKQGGADIKFKLSDLKAQVHGDAAILTGQTSFEVESTEAAPSTYRWTDVFVRQPDGEWRVVASQATAVATSKAAEDTPGE